MRVCQKCRTTYGVGPDYLCAKCRIEIHPQAEIDSMKEPHPDTKHLSNLLAHIHQDGGHYQGGHGTEKAVEDAIKKVGELLHDHPDTRRLGWLLKYISFETFTTNERQYVHICIESTAYANLTWRLERGWRQIDGDDPRAIIDKAMEDDNG